MVSGSVNAGEWTSEVRDLEVRMIVKRPFSVVW
jgi:hypothetical protein